MPFRLFTRERLSSGDLNTYLMGQVVSRFTSSSQRAAQLTAPDLNQLTMRDDAPGRVEYWDGNSWEVWAGADVPVTELELRSGWSAFPGHPVPGYYKDRSGVVHLQGVIRNDTAYTAGASSGIVQFLPTGYRPLGGVFEEARAIGSGILILINVRTDGAIQWVPGGTIPVGTAHHLSGISFHPKVGQ